MALAALISFVATELFLIVMSTDRTDISIPMAITTFGDGTCTAETSILLPPSHINTQPMDQSVFLRVIISPESRVRVLEGNLVPGLVQHAWVDAPISIENQAGVTSCIRLESEQFVDDRLGESRMRWLRVELVPNTPLTGVSWEHRKLRIWSRDQGVRAAAISVNVGQGITQRGTRLPSLPIGWQSPLLVSSQYGCDNFQRF